MKEQLLLNQQQLYTQKTKEQQRKPCYLEDLIPSTITCQNKILPKFKQHIETLKERIDNSPVIDYNYVIQELRTPIPEESRKRSVLWQIALQYVSPFQCNREYNLSLHRDLYKEYVSQFITSNCHSEKQSEQILRDLERTQQDYAFYKQLEQINPMQDTNLSAIFRILYVYQSLNKYYTQGMNEILSVIYMVFKQEGQQEADAFFCFSNLMAYMRPLFTKVDDKQSQGIVTLIKRLDAFVAQIAKCNALMVKRGVDGMLYGISWLTLIFSQHNRGPDCLRLFDVFFAELFEYSQKCGYYCKFGYEKQWTSQLIELRQRDGVKQSQQQLNKIKMSDIFNIEISTQIVQKIKSALIVPLQQNVIDDFSQHRKRSWVDFLLAFSVTVVQEVGVHWNQNSELGDMIDDLNKASPLQSDIESIIQKAFDNLGKIRLLQMI